MKINFITNVIYPEQTNELKVRLLLILHIINGKCYCKARAVWR